MKMRVLAAAPNLLNRIKLRCISVESLHLNGIFVPSEVLMNEFGMMDREVIENEDDLTANAPFEGAHELKYGWPVNVIFKKLKVKSEAFSIRRNRKKTGDRDSVSLI